eukprot:TRINITY_DN1499_c0_g2_i2.p3 TRINITY_DN1499_c0_g2~~TRINITY_DN1499_c0_g2_i2.p3  ORF type:complete len:192 (+),score=68.52 TRINITY_DN1499_c0_g2_i2:66-641(+)
MKVLAPLLLLQLVAGAAATCIEEANGCVTCCAPGNPDVGVGSDETRGGTCTTRCPKKWLQEGDVCRSGGVTTGLGIDRRGDCPPETECRAKAGEVAVGGEVDWTCQKIPEPVCQTDVKRCSDGSFVSRDPKRGCAFKACPVSGFCATQGPSCGNDFAPCKAGYTCTDAPDDECVGADCPACCVRDSEEPGA